MALIEGQAPRTMTQEKGWEQRHRIGGGLRRDLWNPGSEAYELAEQIYHQMMERGAAYDDAKAMKQKARFAWLALEEAFPGSQFTKRDIHEFLSSVDVIDDKKRERKRMETAEAIKKTGSRF